MKYIVPALLLASSAACADTSAQANDTQKGVAGQTSGAIALDSPRPNGNAAQSNILPNVAKMAVAPAEFLSASQYQPQSLQTSGPSPLYSLSAP